MNGCNPAEYTDGDIYAIATIGKLQFIAKDYCGCYRHIDEIFFNSFHHVTRWKLITRQCIKTGKDLICTRYISYNKEILAERLTIDMTEEDYEKLVLIPYPTKHWTTQTVKGRMPPTLTQQCILTIERNSMYDCY